MRKSAVVVASFTSTYPFMRTGEPPPLGGRLDPLVRPESSPSHLLDHDVILRVRTDPEPYGCVILNIAQGAPMNPDPDRVVGSREWMRLNWREGCLGSACQRIKTCRAEARTSAGNSCNRLRNCSVVSESMGKVHRARLASTMFSKRITRQLG